MSKPHYFISAISAAKSFNQQLSMFQLSTEPRRRLDNIISLVHEIAPMPLGLHELTISEEDSAIKGAFIRHEDRYNIFVLSGLNLCWTRFVTCKELMHVVLDCDEYHNIEIQFGSHIEEAVDILPEGSPSACSEQLAEAAAMEVMFPFSEREALIRNGATDYFAIADRYKIPELMVQRYLSEPYMNWFKTM